MGKKDRIILKIYETLKPKGQNFNEIYKQTGIRPDVVKRYVMKMLGIQEGEISHSPGVSYKTIHKIKKYLGQRPIILKIKSRGKKPEHLIEIEDD